MSSGSAMVYRVALIMFGLGTLALIGFHIYDAGKAEGFSQYKALTSHFFRQEQSQPPAHLPPIKITDSPVSSKAVPAPQIKPQPSGTAIITSAEDGRSQSIISNAQRQEQGRHQTVYNNMQQTCQKWTRWYKQDRSSSSAVQMNISCREAANYASRYLGANYQPNYVNLANLPTTSSGASAILLHGSGNKDSNYCGHLENRKKEILNELRAGYRIERGNYLKAQLRDVQDRIYRNCR